MSKKKTTRFKEYISDSADVRPDRLDLRDRMYQPPLSSLPAQVPQQSFKHAVQSYIDADMILDQKKDGACTGFAMAAVINFLFWRKTWHETAGLETAAPETAEQPESADDANQIPSDRDAQWSAHVANLKSAAPKVSARMLYHLARFYDEWPGEQNTGSSLRGAVKAWYRHGVCREEYWRSGATFESPDEKWAIDAATRPVGVYYRISRSSVVDMQAAIHEVGAILVSARIHNGWEALLQTKYNRVQAFTELTHDNIAQIQWTPTTKTLGMHAFALVGYNQYGFIIQNSWGKTWGAGGFAVLTYSDWVNNGVDAWVAVLGAPVEKSSPPLRVYIESSRPRDRLTSKDKSDELVINADFWKRGKGLVTRGGTHQPTNEPKPDVRKWSVQECYEHCITLGSNGRAINRLIDRQNASSATHYIACQRPSEQF